MGNQRRNCFFQLSWCLFSMTLWSQLWCVFSSYFILLDFISLTIICCMSDFITHTRHHPVTVKYVLPTILSIGTLWIFVSTFSSPVRRRLGHTYCAWFVGHVVRVQKKPIIHLIIVICEMKIGFSLAHQPPNWLESGDCCKSFASFSCICFGKSNREKKKSKRNVRNCC